MEPSNEEAQLGLATTEQLFRELICRFKMTQYQNQASGVRRDVIESVDLALELAEMLGALDTRTKEYRTVNS